MNLQFYSQDFAMNIFMLVSLILFSFLFFLFMVFIISLFKRPSKAKLDYAPKMSILIPAYNEEKNIGACLDSVIRADYNMDNIEVIVIDDCSTDSTSSIVKRFIRKHPHVDIKLIKGPHQGKSMSLNLGVSRAKNELLMTIDADIVLSKDSIRKLVAPMAHNDVAATNAVAVILGPKTMLEHFQMIEFCLNNLIRTSFSRVFKNSIWFFGAVACYKKKVLKEVGYFKTDTLTEDMDICLEMFNRRYKIITVEDAFISTIAMHSLAGLFRQRMRWYYGALQSLFKNRRLLRKKKRSAPVIFLFVNQYWWTFFSFVFFPMTAYQVYYWMPQAAAEIFWYVFRWFSFAGPVYVLYKIPQWGLNFLNIFGVSAGIITFIMILAALVKFRGKFNIKTAIAIFFYFPYTIIQDAIILSGVMKYSFAKDKYFIK